MVLQGSQEGFAPPFDASIYGASFSPSDAGEEYEIEYTDCSAIGGLFATDPSVTEILPEGIEPYSTPPTAAVIIAHYPNSTVGEYHEFFAVVQVEDLDGELAYYVPYIYVTNDAAMAAGRELAGAPKKIADIGLDTEGSVYQAHLDRPAGTRLFAAETKPEQRATGGLVDTMLGGRLPLLSIRHLPPIQGGDGCTQLVKWYAEMDIHEDSDGARQWLGPTNLRYEAESLIDPVHKLPVDRQLAGLYLEFDMTLGVTEVHHEWDL